MARYDVAHACGCIETHQLIGPEAERQGKLAWLATTDCSSCYRDAKAAEVAAKTIDLPALEGSAKQIAWAERIRGRLIDVIAEDESQLIAAARTDEVADAVRLHAARLRNQPKASYWIDRDGRGDMRGRLRRLVVAALAPKAG